jgi:hypothetical protein
MDNMNPTTIKTVSKWHLAMARRQPKPNLEQSFESALGAKSGIAGQTLLAPILNRHAAGLGILELSLESS